MKGMISGALTILATVLPARAFDNHDWQFWTTEAVECEITDQWKARPEVEFYFGDDMSDLFYRHADLGLSRKVTPWLGTSFNYRHVEMEKNGDWKQESRPHINGTLYWEMGRCRLSDRNRLEFRMPEGDDPFWRYRNKLRAGLPLERSRFNIEPYVADEVFIDTEQDGVNQNRVSAGVSASGLGHFKVDLYYMLQSSKKVDGGWTDANILGTSLSMAF